MVISHSEKTPHRPESTNLSVRPAVLFQGLLNEGVEVDIGVWQHLPEDHIIVQVIAEDGSNERQWGAKRQALSNVLLYILWCCCRQSQTRNPRHASTQPTQFEVVWPEVMSPLGDTVGLIHRQVRQQTTGAQVRQAGLERRRGNHLRSDVEQLEFGAAAP